MNAGFPGSLALYALTSAGAALARRLAAARPGASVFLPGRLAAPGERAFERLADALAREFERHAGHVVIAAAGIVVRAIAPLIKDKASDPAVVVVDQSGRFAISLLSGHLGGANDLARWAASVLGGQAVITTATDGEGLPSLEIVAHELGLKVANLDALSGVSLSLLEGRPAPVRDPQGWLWPALDRRWPGLFALLQGEPSQELSPLVWVGERSLTPPPGWLVLRPPCLTVGLGCNRGVTADEMRGLLARVFEENGLSPTAIACLASVEAKRDEAGLLELAAGLGLPLIFFPAERLRAVPVPNPSSRVEEHMGTTSVCEAAAILAAKGGHLVVTKHKSQGATLAVARLNPASSG